MHFQSSLTLLVAACSTLSTAAPRPHATDGELAKRDEKSYITDACTGMPDKDGYNYRMGIKWMMNGNIGGDGNPTIESGGGILTFDSDCNFQDEIGWNGGSGHIGEWMKFNPDDEDVGVKFKMASAAFQADGQPRIAPPSDLKFENKGETVHWGHKVDCQKEWSTTEFPSVKYYRMCHFYAGKGNFEDQ